MIGQWIMSIVKCSKTLQGPVHNIQVALCMKAHDCRSPFLPHPGSVLERTASRSSMSQSNKPDSGTHPTSHTFPCHLVVRDKLDCLTYHLSVLSSIDPRSSVLICIGMGSKQVSMACQEGSVWSGLRPQLIGSCFVAHKYSSVIFIHNCSCLCGITFWAELRITFYFWAQNIVLAVNVCINFSVCSNYMAQTCQVIFLGGGKTHLWKREMTSQSRKIVLMLFFNVKYTDNYSPK
jgi:hypothetical protein